MDNIVFCSSSNRLIKSLSFFCAFIFTIIGGKRALAAAADLIKEAVKDSKITITGVFEYGGEASREHIDGQRRANDR